MTTYRLGTTCVTEGCQQLPDVDLEGVGPVCHAHRSARMRADTVRALRAADQHVCPPSPMAHTPIGEGGHNRRSQACGRVALLRNRAAPDRGAFARLFCKSRQCPDCGPRRAHRLHDQYLELLGGWWDTQPDPVLYAIEIAPKAWATMARKLRRAEAAYVRIPLTDSEVRGRDALGPGAEDLVLVAGEGGIGRPIRTREELERTLLEAFTWTSSSAFDKRRPSHRGFEDEPVPSGTAGSASGPADQGKPKPDVPSGTAAGWELLGFAGKGVTLEMAMRAADQLDLGPEPMPDSQLAPDWAEAFTLRLPAEGSAELEVLRRRLRLRSPGEADSVSRRSRLAA